MNGILLRCKKSENINLLKARDAFFDIARKWHRLYLATIIAPVVIAALTYILPLISIPFYHINFSFLDTYRDFIVGISTILFLLVGNIVQYKVSVNCEKSNILREIFDCDVFDLPENEFAYDYGIVRKNKTDYNEDVVKKWRKKPDRDDGKYEAWYGEVFSDNDNYNILCLQMDNVIYTKYAYRDYKKLIRIWIRITYIALGLIMLLFIFVLHNFSAFVLIVFSCTGLIQMLLEMLMKTRELIKNNTDIIKKICGTEKTISDETISAERVANIKQELDGPNGKILLRDLQDIILRNRDQSLFILKSVRELYLEPNSDNKYLNDLNALKKIFFKGTNVSIPEKACEISVLPSKGAEQPVQLDVIHEHLLNMLKDVDEVLRRHNCTYVLDGGTLIGAARENGKEQIRTSGGDFIFWDDDIDIAVKYSQLGEIKDYLQEELPNGKYALQDYENDDFYSPRLSNLRIREKNFGYLSEKDSPLFPKYKEDSHGLFIDVYAYGPIIESPEKDAKWRKKNIHKLNEKLKELEFAWKYQDDEERKTTEEDFKNRRKEYLDKVDDYIKLAKCEEYYCYIPNYIDNIKTPGPYIKKEDLFGDEKNELEFANHLFPVPANPKAVLEKFYGENWYISPFKTKDEILREKREEELYFGNLIEVKSKKKGKSNKRINFFCTVLKHYTYFDRGEKESGQENNNG